ncbi:MULTISPECIES: LysR family transcriptional regulator [Vibrio]|uniref:LysR family transcriptional regulator n=1 Tax=Vibrio TaxID=662 RepID=UPI00056FE3A5|nr:LysR family transcriptional regulator [Vibrio pacinii]
MNFSLEQLTTFVAVYEKNSFSKGAEVLNRHRSTVGQVIVNLEEILMIPLFHRVGRSVTPTEEADLLYRYAKQAVEQVKAFDKLATNLADGELESINIGYCSFLPQLAIADLRIQLAKDFPDLRVNLFVRNTSEIKAQLESGQLHFGLVNVHHAKAMNSIHTTYLETLSMVPFGNKGGELAKTPPSEMFAKLKNSKQLILQSLIDEGMADKVTLSANFELVDQLSVMIKLVQLGHGWALLPRSVIYSEYVKQNLVQLQVDEFKKSLEIPISLWSLHSVQISKIRQSIITALEEYISHILDEYNLLS